MPKSDYYSDRGENLKGQGGPLFQQIYGLLAGFDEEWYSDPEREKNEWDAGACNKCQ
jgi:hypothetical protein